MLGQSGRPRLTRAGVCAILVGAAVALMAPAWAETPSEAAASDVRILIDISGSMRDTDPQNRRTPAINLLIDAIPGDATAGIWSFGRYVNLLVPHDPVNAQWRAQARTRVAELRAIAQRTNLGAALDDAAYDFGFSTYSPPTDVILITDGQVDIAPNSDVNRVERDRILDTVIPRFAAAGARIHTLALGSAADAGLLEQMANQTGGVFAEVQQPSEMQSFIIRVLNSVRPGNELPFDGREFRVDAQVTELTALVMHDDGQVELRQPNGTLNSVSSPGSQRWQAGQGYTLISIDTPPAGRWEVLGDINDDSSIQVVSDVNLYWTQPSGSVVLQDQPLILELGVADASGDVVPDALINVMTPTLRINGSQVDGLRWDGRQLRAQVPNTYADADIQLEVTLDGGTFQRQIRKTVVNRPALLSELLVTDAGIQWRLYPADRGLMFEQVSLQAMIEGPVTQNQGFQTHASGYFYMNLPADLPEGDYRLTLTGDADVNERRVSQFGVAPIDLSLPLPADWPRILNPEAMPAEPTMMPEPEPEADFVKEPMPEFEELSVQTPVSIDQPDAEPVSEPLPQSDPTPWLRYLLLSVPGLLILLAFFLVYRRLDRRSKGETEDLLAEDRGLADVGMNELNDLELSADLDDPSLDSGVGDGRDGQADEQDAPVVDDVFEDDVPEPSPPERTEAPRVSMEDSLDTRALDEDVWGELDSEPDPLDDLDAGDDDDLFDISNLEDGLSDLENLNLDEDDPFSDDNDDPPSR
ncbi:VWA domain-containing protein [Saccharospirillum impatiens]|uniref:VWA domain-containing protein n=1 Tax=Saccharospirillum impatiens TaxID=169438 RepID=UPI0003FEDE77|nr:VWA domain-containing protein [Saccharospirillum impatiens]